MANNKKTVQDKNLLEFTMSEFTKHTFDCVCTCIYIFKKYFKYSLLYNTKFLIIHIYVYTC